MCTLMRKGLHGAFEFGIFVVNWNNFSEINTQAVAVVRKILCKVMIVEFTATSPLH